MASILGRYGRGREDGFFKQEQEADIQVLRKRLIEEGRFSEEYLGAETLNALQQNGDVSPVLMEVLQASSRMSVPDAARRRVWELRRRAGLPPLPDAELAKAVRQLKLGSAALLVPAEMSLSHSGSWRTAREAADSAEAEMSEHTSQMNKKSKARHPASASSSSGEVNALSSRQMAVALRTAVYGTMGSIVLIAGAATAAAAYYDIWTVEQARSSVHLWGQTWREPIRNAVLPWASWARSWLRDD